MPRYYWLRAQFFGSRMSDGSVICVIAQAAALRCMLSVRRWCLLAPSRASAVHDYGQLGVHSVREER